MSNMKTLWLITLLWLAPGVVLAEAADGSSPAEETAAEPAAAEPATKPATDKDDETAKEEGVGHSADVFIPTEEISEDFAVSFPVDI
ncbi:MAG: hypothetical protein P8Y69_08400 [Gammaproteobacteria bacterium]